MTRKHGGWQKQLQNVCLSTSPSLLQGGLGLHVRAALWTEQAKLAQIIQVNCGH